MREDVILAWQTCTLERASRYVPQVLARRNILAGEESLFADHVGRIEISFSVQVCGQEIFFLQETYVELFLILHQWTCQTLINRY